MKSAPKNFGLSLFPVTLIELIAFGCKTVKGKKERESKRKREGKREKLPDIGTTGHQINTSRLILGVYRKELIFFLGHWGFGQ